ncbi:hypothetical protein [Streptomyces indicus]|uniref:Uncharacterized protein n=1 Tax=Streptomyces indicus TaxID=417292 RepID=A0A1G9CNC2_9ACTN|nr:hypothetical protein [Streptomyces indicus]SDK53086.1 hypothetical protein SAMN05421806_108220 [Streptomyces indicus]
MPDTTSTPSQPDRRRLPRAAFAAAAAVALSLTALASGAHADGLQPPPFPPPGGIEVNEKGEPQGEGNKTQPVAPVAPPVIEPEEPAVPGLPELPQLPKDAQSWNPFSGVADLVHGAVDPWLDMFRPKSARGAATAPLPPTATNWGTVVSTDEPAQANAWALRALGAGGGADARLVEAHLPALPHAPAAANVTKPLELGKKYSFGTLHHLSARTFLQNGAVHAEARIGRAELGVPYLKAAGKPVPEKRLPVRLELRDAVTTATGRADRAPEFRTEVGGGSVVSFGRELHRFDGPLKPNTGLRLPADSKLPAWGLLTLNEQITTDAQGHPTTGKHGGYAPDPQATSGYANAAHLTLLFPEALDMTAGHAAVLHKGTPAPDQATTAPAKGTPAAGPHAQ